MVFPFKKKKREDEAVVAAPESELVDVGTKLESTLLDNGTDKTRYSVESFDIGTAWLMRIKRLQDTFDTRLWKASAVGGDPEIEGDLSWIELTHKCECAFIELRCALTTTADAPQVIVRSRAQLDSLKTLVGIRDYPRAVLGMIQSVMHEQQMGFHTTPGSVWDFDEAAVDSDYARALKEWAGMQEKVGEAADG